MQALEDCHNVIEAMTKDIKNQQEELQILKEQKDLMERAQKVITARQESKTDKTDRRTRTYDTSSSRETSSRSASNTESDRSDTESGEDKEVIILTPTKDDKKVVEGGARPKTTAPKPSTSKAKLEPEKEKETKREPEKETKKEPEKKPITYKDKEEKDKIGTAAGGATTPRAAAPRATPRAAPRGAAREEEVEVHGPNRNTRLYNAQQARQIMKARNVLYPKIDDFYDRYIYQEHNSCCGTPRERPCVEWNLSECKERDGHVRDGYTMRHICHECYDLLLYHGVHKATCIFCPCKSMLRYAERKQL